MTPVQTVGGWIELVPWEIGQTYTVPFTYRVVIEGFPSMVIPKDWQNDGDTGVINFKEWDKTLPPLPAPDAHDFGYKFKRDELLNYHGQDTWDGLYRALNRASTNWGRRRVANFRYWGLNTLGIGSLAFRYTYPVPAKMPAEWEKMFGESYEAAKFRSKLPVLTINSFGRLEMTSGVTDDSV